jgi:H+/Cl- antiporter ClcA
LFIKNTCASLLSDSLKKLSFLFSYLGKWFFLALLVGALSGSASALFLHALDWTTQTRESNYWLLMFLPLGGLLIGLTNHYFGENVLKGNNLIIENHNETTKRVAL